MRLRYYYHLLLFGSVVLSLPLSRLGAGSGGPRPGARPALHPTHSRRRPESSRAAGSLKRFALNRIKRTPLRPAITRCFTSTAARAVQVIRRSERDAVSATCDACSVTAKCAA
ncbi:unnamed protein product, partial [Iphiclides podalirius]